jgi:subtilisin family serine protease
MSSEKTVTEQFVTPAPDDIVSFSVVVQPRAGVPIEEIRTHLTLDTLHEYEASESRLARVKHQLRRRGFEVFNLQSPVVSARGRVDRFQEVFGGKLLKWVRTTTTVKSTRVVSAIVLDPEAPRPSPEQIEGAALIAVAPPPRFVVPAIPDLKGSELRLPGDVAQLTGASATHRLTTPGGERATGSGVRVAVIDSGFAQHPYFDQHGYNITRLAAPDSDSPEVDDEPHGTAVIAALLACAPDVEALGIKVGDNYVLALDFAMACPNLSVISISWVYDLVDDNGAPLDLVPLDLVPIWMRILDAISAGVTIVAAAGNGQTAFPAMMPEVLAVGGVAIDPHDDHLEAWDGGSSFSSAIFQDRNVPDVCAFASDMGLPIPAAEGYWMSDHGTSFAAPQVCGIAALLLQKNPALGPNDIRTALTITAVDITRGTTATGDTAGVGSDRATGAGLVSARQAWQFV